jgi:hypothetical protein
MDDLMLTGPEPTRSHRPRRVRIGLAVLAAGAVAAALAAPLWASSPPNVSAEACLGSSSLSSGTWTFAAGTASFPTNNTTSCSLATTAAPAADFEYESLAAAVLNLSGTGNQTCSSATGTLSSPSLSTEVASNSSANVVSTGVGGYAGFDNTAYIVWTAKFLHGIGTLSGTMFGATGFSSNPGALDPASTPTHVTGHIKMVCGAGSAVVLLTFNNMPPA